MVASTARNMIMKTIDRDPQFIADRLRMLRKMFRLTQENLADAANVSRRTIEKSESGRHRPNEQTLRSIARSIGIDVQFFDKPTPEQEARQKAEMEHALRKIVVAKTRPVRTASDILDMFDQRNAFRTDISAVTDDEALETAAAMAASIRDMNDIWEDSDMSQRLGYARDFAEFCQRIEEHGYLCHIGHHRQRLREKGKSDLVFTIGIMSIQRKDEADGERFAIVELEAPWETLEEDWPGLQ